MRKLLCGAKISSCYNIIIHEDYITPIKSALLILEADRSSIKHRTLNMYLLKK